MPRVSKFLGLNAIVPVKLDHTSPVDLWREANPGGWRNERKTFTVTGKGDRDDTMTVRCHIQTIPI